MERTRFTVFVTKYALTKGIFEREVEDCFDISPDLVSVVGSWSEYYHANDWHRTREEAVARAEQMRIAKIGSLKKQIARLEKLSFGETS